MKADGARTMNGKAMRIDAMESGDYDMSPSSAAETLRRCNDWLEKRGLLQSRSFCFGSFHKKKQEGSKL
jgi:hypothetical protein